LRAYFAGISFERISQGQSRPGAEFAGINFTLDLGSPFPRFGFGIECPGPVNALAPDFDPPFIAAFGVGWHFGVILALFAPTIMGFGWTELETAGYSKALREYKLRLEWTGMENTGKCPVFPLLGTRIWLNGAVLMGLWRKFGVTLREN